MALLEELAGLAAEWDPTGRASLAIVSADGTLYGFNERRQHISASAVKPLWTAAAIDLASLAAVEPLAPAALVHSDNFAAGGIIDLIGIDTVNTWGAPSRRERRTDRDRCGAGGASWPPTSHR